MNNKELFKICNDANEHTIIFELKKYLKKISELEKEDFTFDDVSLLCSEIKSFIFSVPFLKNELLKKAKKINEIIENENNDIFFRRIHKITQRLMNTRKNLTDEEKELFELYPILEKPKIFLLYSLIPIMGNPQQPIRAKNRFKSEKDITSFYLLNIAHYIYEHHKNIKVQDKTKVKKYISPLYFILVKHPLFRDFQYIDFFVFLNEEDRKETDITPLTDRFFTNWFLSAARGTIIKLIDLILVHSSMFLFQNEEETTEEQKERLLFDKYTEREKEIIRQLSLTRKEIAQELRISPYTVQEYIDRIAEKSGIKGGKKELMKHLLPKMS